MKSDSSLAAPSAPTVRPRRRGLRPFHPVLGILMLAVMAIGFQHYYLDGRAHPGRDIPPPLRGLVFVHGVAMSAWVLIFLVQSLLVSAPRPRVRLHRTIGWCAVALAVIIVISGLMLTVESTRVAPPELVIWGMTSRQFMAVSFFSILLFGGMVATAVAFRHRRDIHGAMLCFATISALGAATGRIDAISALYQGTALEHVFGPFLGILVLGALVVVVRCIQTRSFDRWFAVSYAMVLAAFVLTIQIARTEAWEHAVAFLVR